MGWNRFLSVAGLAVMIVGGANPAAAQLEELPENCVVGYAVDDTAGPAETLSPADRARREVVGCKAEAQWQSAGLVAVDPDSASVEIDLDVRTFLTDIDGDNANGDSRIDIKAEGLPWTKNLCKKDDQQTADCNQDHDIAFTRKNSAGLFEADIKLRDADRFLNPDDVADLSAVTGDEIVKIWMLVTGMAPNDGSWTVDSDIGASAATCDGTPFGTPCTLTGEDDASPPGSDDDAKLTITITNN